MYRPTSTSAGVHEAFDSPYSSFARHEPLTKSDAAVAAAPGGTARAPGDSAERRRQSRSAPEAFTKPNRKLAISMRRLEVLDVVRAIRIALSNFGSEIHLIALSYFWYFWRRAGLADVGAMWCMRSVDVELDGPETASFEYVSSFIHGRDVAWIDLAGINGSSANAALAAIKQWPRQHRLLIVRVHRSIAQRFLAAGFEVAGMVPDGTEQHCYLHATRLGVTSADGPNVRIKFGRRRSLSSKCEFSVVEREGKVVGLSGIYGVAFWRGVTWGAWGAMDPAHARRDAVFETLRLTEERARADGASWFCLETSDSSKYRHARKIYELYGLELLLAVPNFYADGDSGAETYMVFGKSLTETAHTRTPGKVRRAFDVVAA